MKIDIETLKKTKGIGSKTIERVMEQHNMEQGLASTKDDYSFDNKYLLNDKYNLWQGNSLKLMKHIPDNTIDLIVTDPPYLTTSRGCYGNSGGMLSKPLGMKGWMFTHNSVKTVEYASSLHRVLKDGSHCYIMTNHKNLIETLNVFQDAGFHFIKSLIWNKGNKIMGRFYMSQFEYILFFRKGKGVQINHCGTSDILSIPNKKTKNAEGQNIHDTEKPVALMEILVGNSSEPDDIVLDCFMGSGSTGVACKNLNRRFIGIELDENYFDIAKERING